MRIQVHDFGGYAFAVDLSEHLARLGHVVDHVFSEQYSNNVGDFAARAAGVPGLSVTPLSASVPAEKYAPVGRLRFELNYASAWKRHTAASRPDIVVTANMPLVTLSATAGWLRRQGVSRVLWHQDVVSTAMADELHRKLPAPIARAGARVLELLERGTTRSAGAIVAISETFAPVYRRWDVQPDRVSTVRNWAPIGQISPRDRDNSFSRAVFTGDRPRLVYAGTIGRKHRPELLIDLARSLSELGAPVDLVVVSEGAAAQALDGVDAGGSTIRVLPFQPARDLPDVLGSADVLVALLEPDASVFSVPSKVMSYLAAGRPVIGLLSHENPAAVDIRAAGGFVAAPTSAGAAEAARWLAERIERADLSDIGELSRRHAEAHFAPVAAVESISRSVLSVRSDEEHRGESVRRGRPVLVVELTGGLANQLFQWASVEALGARGIDVGFDTGRALRPGDSGDRLTDMGLRIRRARLSSRERVTRAALEMLPSPIRLKVAARTPSVAPRTGLTAAEDLTSAAALLAQGRSVWLRSYLQDPEVFSALRTELGERVRALLPESPAAVSGVPYAAMHVRRGDYLLPQNLEKIGACSIEYYLAAADRLDPELPLVIVSDDPVWCEQELLPRLPPSRTAEVLTGGSDLQDLSTLSGAASIAMSNSTFSWWGAFLGSAGVVVAPRPWFTAAEAGGEGLEDVATDVLDRADGSALVDRRVQAWS